MGARQISLAVAQRSVGTRWARQGLLLVAGALCIWVLTERLEGLSMPALWRAAGSIGWAQWVAAGLATAVSYWALGRYDRLAHAICRTLTGPAAAQRAGLCAIAMSQTVGLGLVTGTLVRWKLLPDLTLAEAAKVTGLVSIGFMTAWAGLTALAFGLVVPGYGWLAALVLVGALALVALSFWRPSLAVRPLPLPSVRQMAALCGLAAVDLGAAAMALWVLLPPGALHFIETLPTLWLALGLGLGSGTPGGVGAFDLTLAASWSTVGIEPLLAAILCFRLLYFALPATAAGLWMLHDHFTVQDRPVRLPPPLRPNPAPRAETALIPHNGGRVLTLGPTAWACLDSGQALVALYDPLAGEAEDALHRLQDQARATGRSALVYKATPGLAIQARRAGWQAVHLCDEAQITPARFDPGIRSRRQLRRKLRHAEKAGVTTRRWHPGRDAAEVARLAALWRAHHGRERGVTMGRFDPAMLQGQMVWIAEQEGQPIGFASFHITPQEVCLDLMRHGPNLPDGTMHALVMAALREAQTNDIALFSLAAAPATKPGWKHRLVHARAGGTGLRQFKDSFGPVWKPRYALAPHRADLVIGLADLARAVHWPDNIAPPPKPATQD